MLGDGAQIVLLFRFVYLFLYVYMYIYTHMVNVIEILIKNHWCKKEALDFSLPFFNLKLLQWFPRPLALS